MQQYLFTTVLELKINFPIMPCIHLPIKFCEERKPVDTTTEGREAFITANCNFSENMFICKCQILKGQLISEANYGVLDSYKKQMKITVLIAMEMSAQDNDFCLLLEEFRTP